MIFITGDTHGDIREFQQRLLPYRLTEDDVLIITGDFGFDWDNHVIMQWLKFDHPYTVLFCDGNHENFDVLNALTVEDRFGGPVGRFDFKTFRLMTGNIYDIQGMRTFVFGGAASIDKDWRLEPENIRWMGKLWWEQEVPSPETFELARKTLREHNWTFDLFLTHTCNPDLRRMILGKDSVLSFTDPVEDMILELIQEIYKNDGGWAGWYFGHLHRDKDLEDRHCLYKRVVPVSLKVGR